MTMTMLFYIYFLVLILLFTLTYAKRPNLKSISARSSAIIASSVILCGSTQIIIEPPPSMAASIRTCTKHNVGSLFPRSCSDSNDMDNTNSKIKKNNAEHNAGLLLFDSVRLAALPITLNSLIAGTAAEACAGAVGAVASRGVADALGDKKVDSLLTKTTSTGAFFGSRGVLRLFARLLGLPRPLAIGFASILASVVSENVKITSRSRTIKSEKKDGDYVSTSTKPGTTIDSNCIDNININADMVASLDISTTGSLPSIATTDATSSSVAASGSGTIAMKRPVLINGEEDNLARQIQEPPKEDNDVAVDEESEGFTSVEIAVDIWKWIQYDFLVETLDFPSQMEMQYLEYFGVGALSSTSAVILGSLLERNERSQRLNRQQETRTMTDTTTTTAKEVNIHVDISSHNYDLTSKKILFSALEGGALFAFYQAFLETGKALLPRELGSSPLFLDSVLETIEKNFPDA